MWLWYGKEHGRVAPGSSFCSTLGNCSSGRWICHVTSFFSFLSSMRLSRCCCCCCHGQPGQEIAMLNGKSTSTIMHDGRSMALQRPAWPIAKKLNIFCLRFFTHTHTHTKNPSSRVGRLWFKRCLLARFVTNAACGRTA